jgi:hypothetical protein
MVTRHNGWAWPINFWLLASTLRQRPVEHHRRVHRFVVGIERARVHEPGAAPLQLAVGFMNMTEQVQLGANFFYHLQ